MKSTFTPIKLLTTLLSLVLLFHFFIILKIIPYSIAWGGRLTNDQEMYVFEGVSIAINVLLILVLALKAQPHQRKWVDVLLWVFFGVFVLNTIGNLLAQTTFEKCFSVVTLGFAVLIWKIVRPTKKSS